MQYTPLTSKFFSSNRQRLKALLPPNSLAVLNANDTLPTNADARLPMVANSDLYYLSGVEQEESILVIYPDADDEKHREILFLRTPTTHNELWEGHKLTKEEARELTGIQQIHWLSDFSGLFHRLMCECSQVFLNTNEHKRAVVDVETREARFVADTQRRYPVHDYRRLAPLMHQLRAVKAKEEVALMRSACELTGAAFERVMRMLRPGVTEKEVEAEYAHEFIRNGQRFSFPPIIASGRNACCLHYTTNASTCRKGEVLLLDVACTCGNHIADMTRTIPVSGRFSPRQRKVYEAVLRVQRQCVEALKPGKKPKDWQAEAEKFMEKELVDLKLLTTREIKKQSPDSPAVKKYFPHGIGHPAGLDVHDVGIVTQPMQENWVMTVEPGIYIPEEGLGVRIEDCVLVTGNGPINLMANVPVEVGEIEAIMKAAAK
jgi:Xaa-Pro aminopeptidase